MEINWKDLELEKDRAINFPLDKLFKLYNLNINKSNTKSICPFPSHNNGNERTASFMYYPESNTYWCFGCKQGNSSIDFVKYMDGLNYHQALNKISLLNNDGPILSRPNSSFEEYFKKYNEFSSKLNVLFRNDYDKAMEIMKSFDEIRLEYSLNHEEVVKLIDKLILRIR